MNGASTQTGALGSRSASATNVRPGSITAAGIVFIVLGPLSAVWGILGMSGGGAQMIGALGAAVEAIGVLVLILGILEIWTGVKILGLSRTWRTVGLIIAAITAVLNLFGLFGGEDVAANVGGLALSGTLIWALLANARAFTR